MSFPISGNDMASVMQRKNINDRKKDKEYDVKEIKNNFKDRPTIIEYYEYKNRKFKIIEVDEMYQAISGQMVVADKDLEVLKNETIPEYVENEIKNRRSFY